MKQPVVRHLTAADLPAVTQVHINAFADSALTHLGRSAVYRYYHWLLTGLHPERYCIGIFDNEVLLGFCFGGQYNGAMSGFLRQNFLPLSLSILSHPRQLMTNQRFRQAVGRGTSILWRFRRQRITLVTEVDAAPTLNRFGILAIAVDPAHQRQKIGQALMQAAETEALRRRADYLLLTIHSRNRPAVAFYQRCGFVEQQDGSGKDLLFVKLISYNPIQLRGNQRSETSCSADDTHSNDYEIR